jgi:predicted PurR-regulated permease PerM
MSILYGQIVLGIVQGIIAGLGFFIFRVPNSFILTLLAILAGVFPIIGTSIVWIPVMIYLLIAGNTFSAFGVAIFGISSSIIENLFKPIWISRLTKVNSSIILIGMIGGLLMFGILGVILGPLILSYLLIVLEIYRNKKIPGAFIEEPAKKS